MTETSILASSDDTTKCVHIVSAVGSPRLSRQSTITIEQGSPP